MTEQEAIQFFRDDMPLKISGYDSTCDAYDMAIEALEKQIPMKIVAKYQVLPEYNADGCQIGAIYLLKSNCPVCGCEICNGEFELEDMKSVKFCDNCGQAIDWTEDES